MNIQADSGIVTIPRADALKIYTTPGAIKPYLDQVRAEVDAFQALGTTVDTAEGRQAIKSFAFCITRTKGALKSIGDVLAADVKEIPKKVDATRRLVREQLEAWEDEVRRPLTEWEDAEKARVTGHEAALREVEGWAVFPGEWTSDQIRSHIDACKAHPHQTRDWQEFANMAQDFIAGSMNGLERCHARAVKDEENAAELARLRAAEEARAAREREEKAAREAEERDRKIAEQAAAAERGRAEQARQRIEREKQDAEERAARAQALADARAREAEAKAAQAVEDERRRQADEKARLEREAAAREADKKHRARINNEAKSALIASGLSDAASVAAVTAIARGEVPHVKISY